MPRFFVIENPFHRALAAGLFAPLSTAMAHVQTGVSNAGGSWSHSGNSSRKTCGCLCRFEDSWQV
ncbi:hypothetical protein BDW62DRAFT_198627 [Aspergillus aurantiobrunneus]